ncbi:hypothetical protein AB1Y20_009622 [Prymnesium parvum]|uniref:Uncharacterized protein n=1 Tax=Prymnesium parvum TaxID=97485 RepID=A0AB34K6F4_PRYPA
MSPHISQTKPKRSAAMGDQTMPKQPKASGSSPRGRRGARAAIPPRALPLWWNPGPGVRNRGGGAPAGVGGARPLAHGAHVPAPP